MMKNKRGQEAPSGGGAATLVGIITLLFIFYILFLPPAEREELLAEDNITEGIDTETPLLRAAIGWLETVPQNEIEHTIPNVYLQELKSAQVISLMSPFTIKKTLTSSETKNFTFGISDPASTESVMLSFAAPKRQGTLKVVFNGYNVFEGEITQLNPAPISIDKNYLQQINTVLFEVKGFGLPPKEYSFTDVKVIGDVVDVMRMIATETIPIADIEYNNLEKATLTYYAACDQLSAGLLEISFNGKPVFSGMPSCDSPGKLDLFQEDIKPGKNLITFRTSKGSIGIEQLQLDTTLKPTKGYSNFFTVSQSLYAAVKKGDARVVLNIEFVDAVNDKRVQTNINGRLDIIDQKEAKFERDISNVIVNGNNYVELTPLTNVNIAKLEIMPE